MARLTAARARPLLAAARIARLASVSAEGTPHVVPVTFALDGDIVYTAVDGKPKTTHGLRRLENIRRDPRVAVLADHYDEDWARLWWVRADGSATIVAEPALMAAPIARLAQKYPQYEQVPIPGPVIAIQVMAWTGWTAAGPNGAGPTGAGGSRGSRPRGRPRGPAIW
jgi:PPOX class probable F420-dependent enzyme